jgi:DNA polymerase V
MAAQRTYLAIDLKSFYASVECVDRHPAEKGSPGRG